MNYNVKKLSDLKLEHKKVLLRLDLNVPIKDGIVLDDNRIRAALPTIKYLLAQNAKIIILSHLGRIKSLEDKKAIDKSLKPIYEHLQTFLPSTKISFSNETCHDEITKQVNQLEDQEILVLENTRFYDVDCEGNVVKKESKNDLELGKFWASLADVFVNDAFGTAHRAHASNVGIANNISDAAVGLLIEKELTMLAKACDTPKKPLVAVLGGAKIEDKIKTIEKIATIADKILIGGGMAFTFLKVQGHEIGKSLLDENSIPIVKKFLEELKDKIVLPVDFECSSSIEGLDLKYVGENEPIPSDMMGLDIGPKSISLFNQELAKAQTIIWNGPLGIFENPKFANGTKAVCQIIAGLTKSGTFTLIGGGDSAAAAIKFGYENDFSHISTGGGASLAYLEGNILPGIAALNKK
ncbi:MAG: phosphoglycerate kinase [Mycoplasmoidaceae bacterium]